MDDALAAAFRVATTHVGDAQLLSVVAAGDDVPGLVLRDLGVTPARVRELFPDTAERSSTVTVTPAAYGVLGVARGLALAAGVPVDRTHTLLALLYSESPAILWRLLGVAAVDVVARLAAAGVNVPPNPPNPRRVAPVTGGVTFPEADLVAVVAALIRAYPPGPDVRWSMNRRDGRGFVHTHNVPEVLDLVRATVADPGSVRPID